MLVYCLYQLIVDRYLIYLKLHLFWEFTRVKIGVAYIKVTVGCDGRRLILKTLACDKAKCKNKVSQNNNKKKPLRFFLFLLFFIVSYLYHQAAVGDTTEVAGRPRNAAVSGKLFIWDFESHVPLTNGNQIPWVHPWGLKRSFPKPNNVPTPRAQKIVKNEPFPACSRGFPVGVPGVNPWESQ